MSKQWGHGFHSGAEQGTEVGRQIGEATGSMRTGEYAWHAVCAAIDAFEREDNLRGIMLLRLLRCFLADSTGRDKV